MAEPERGADGLAELQVTCPDDDTAQRIAEAAIAARLAACANILPGVTSVFHWQGAVETETEVMVTFKTTLARAGELAALIVRAHPYDTPAVTWWPVAATDATAGWARAETGG